ncbi:MAG: hypothetical protein LBF36_01725, partial [Mycoplasmataceae bacterium]|nr:hypothetical protein [Mycoplasmataceae bacterium]
MPVITYQALLNLTQQRCSPNYHYYAKRYHACFTSNYESDIKLANQIVDSIVNHNSAHSICSMFRWCYDHFYDIEFNHKHLHKRSCAIAKFTSRLDLD